MKLACTDSVLPEGSYTQKAAFLKEVGFDGMAVFAEPASWNDKLTGELLDLKKNTGISCCEFVFMGEVYGHLMDKDPKIQRQAIDLYKESIAICNELGAITEMEYQYCPQDPLPLFEPYLKMPEDEQKVFIDIIHEFDSVLKDGAYMLIEGCNRYETRYLNCLADCKEMVLKAGAKRVALLADFFHMSIEENDLAQSILDCGSLIKHVHIGDSNRLAPGKGHTDWKSSMAALKQIGFAGYANMECNLSGDLKQELLRIRRFFDDIEAELC